MAIYTLMLLDLCICGLYMCVTAQSRQSAHQLPQLIRGDCQYAFFQVTFKQIYENILYILPPLVQLLWVS